MYKIGREWLFDEKKKEGYKVSLNHQTGKVVKITKAFTLKVNGDEIECLSDKQYAGDIPFGVIRKASHLMELDTNGSLVAFERMLGKQGANET